MLQIIKFQSGVFMFENPRTNSSPRYFYNETELPLAFGSNLVNGRMISTTDEPKRIYYIGERNDLIHMANVENESETISKSEYDERVKSLRYYDDDKDEYAYKSLEDEFSCRTFIAKYKPVYKKSSFEQDVAFEVLEYPESKNQYIMPSRMLNGDYKKAIFFYTPNLKAFLHSIATEFDFTEAQNDSQTQGRKYKNATHSGLRYCKINGNYAFEDKDESFFKGCTGTYEECEDKYNRHIARLRAVFRRQEKLIEDSKLNSANFRYVLGEAEYIKRTLFSIIPIKKSEKEYRNLISRVDNFVKELLK